MSHGHMRIGEKDTPKSAFYNQGRFGVCFRRCHRSRPTRS